MISEPLLQNNIIENIIRNFQYYLSFDCWFYYALGALLSFSLICKFIKPAPQTLSALFPPAKNNSKPHPLALLPLFLVLISYSIVIFSLENSFFNNYDLMNLSTQYILSKGVTPFLNFTRFAPVAFFDLNFVYAITHNFHLINTYIILKQILIAILFYHFLNFITPTKRLFCIAVLLFVPAIFWMNNIIFCEQNLLIFVLASLILVRKFSQTQKFSYLCGFTIFSLAAVYTKETTIIFYFGILVSGILYNIFNGKINLSTLFNPPFLIKNFPIEFIIFLIGLSFASFYFFIADTSESNIYINLHHQSLTYLLKLYEFEIIIIILAWIIMLYKILKHKITYPQFDEGLMLGGTFILLFIIFYLQMAPVSTHVELKSYYALLPAIFGFIYIVKNLPLKKLLIPFLACCFIYSAFTNYKIYKNEVGHYYREVAEFFAKETSNNTNTIITFSPHTEELDWIREGWAISFQYYFPNRNIIFNFSDLAEKNTQNETTLFLYKRLQKNMKPIIGISHHPSGEYYIIKNDIFEQDYPIIKDLEHKLVFKNKLFRIYKIK